MSRPLLKLGGGSGDSLSDVLHLPGVSEAETVISGAEGRDELRHIPDHAIRLTRQSPYHAAGFRMLVPWWICSMI